MKIVSPSSSALAKIGRKRSADRSSPATLVAISMPRSPSDRCSRSSSATASSGAWNGTVPSPTKRSGWRADDVGDVVVDRARGGDAEIGRRVVIGLVRRGRERLDVDPHHVHVGEPLFHRGELHPRPFRLLPVDLARARIGEHIARPAFDLTGGAEHRLGHLGQHVAVDIDGEVLAARMRWTGEPTWDARIGRKTTEQHLCNSRSTKRLICDAFIPARPIRSSVRASPEKSLPVIARTSVISASIAGVGTPAAAPRALIGISPTGTSSVMYLWSNDFGVPVA